MPGQGIDTPLNLVEETVGRPHGKPEVVVRSVPGGEVKGRVTHLPDMAVVGGNQRVPSFQRDVTGAGVVEIHERAPRGGLGRAVVLVLVRDFVPEVYRL